jgi:serine/threonine-protein kinase
MLDYGQTRSVGAITCDSEPSGMACTDSSTGHYFRRSRVLPARVMTPPPDSVTAGKGNATVFGNLRLRRRATISLAVGAVLVVAAVVSVSGVVGHRSSRTTTTHPSRSVSYSSQVVLPFANLVNPNGVAVDTGGNLYVVDFGGNRVWELAVGASAPTVLPFTDLTKPQGVAMDTAGNLYVTDGKGNRVLKLAAGASTPTMLPFTGLNHPGDVAVDTAGNVYVADEGNNRVLKLAAA